MTKNIDPLKAVRNLLAHAPMRHHHKLSVGAQRVAAASSWIEVAISADEELVRAKKLTVRDTDLPGHLEEVRRLAADLQSFMGSLRK